MALCSLFDEMALATRSSPRRVKRRERKERTTRRHSLLTPTDHQGHPAGRTGPTTQHHHRCRRPTPQPASDHAAAVAPLQLQNVTQRTEPRTHGRAPATRRCSARRRQPPGSPQALSGGVRMGPVMLPTLSDPDEPRRSRRLRTIPRGPWLRDYVPGPSHWDRLVRGVEASRTPGCCWTGSTCCRGCADATRRRTQPARRVARRGRVCPASPPEQPAEGDQAPVTRRRPPR
jgi:hypothetical protein